MRACTVAPGRPDTAGVEEIAEPAPDVGEVLVEGLLVGVCGTDVEITTAGYGWPPPGHERLVMFHESLGRVEEALPAALPADLVVLNPPRGGLDSAVPPALLAQPPARLIYVSCDPATLARDVARLAGAFALRSLRCFDLFPQTAHVETVAELVRTGGDPPAE